MTDGPSRPSAARLEELRSSNHPVVAELFAEIDHLTAHHERFKRRAFETVEQLEAELRRVTQERDALCEAADECDTPSATAGGRRCSP